ncbi:MAG: rhodanese-like domain-containing protein [Archangium sp.]|nr:rhodanese-like domain-containing protein [Archangium sp.]
MKPASLVLITLLGLSACAAPTITGEAAHQLVQKQGALLLDVRTPQEFAEGHVDGAVNVPVQELEAKLASLPAKKDQDVVIYCRSGVRSARASGILKTAGFTRVHDLGAMSNWR